MGPARAYRQLSLLHQQSTAATLGRNLSLAATNDLLMRLLGRNLSLVAGDFHLATSLSRDLRPKWVLLVQSRPKWVLLVQSRPKWALLVQSSTLLSLVRLGDGPLTRLSVPRTTHLARGVIPPHPHRLRIANNGTINRTKRIIFVLPHWNFF